MDLSQTYEPSDMKLIVFFGVAAECWVGNNAKHMGGPGRDLEITGKGKVTRPNVPPQLYTTDSSSMSTVKGLKSPSDHFQARFA